VATFYHDEDADLDLIRGRRIAAVGYGNQGQAHALNLRDSGCEVRVGLQPGSRSWLRAEADGFLVQTVAEVCGWADFMSILLPDQLHRRVYQGSIRDHLSAGKMLLFAHGFSIHYHQIVPPPDVDVAMVAPRAPGAMMRRLFVEGKGVLGGIAVQQDATGQADQLALAYARGIGCTRSGVIGITFREETEMDLFGEQAVLCGGLSVLVKAGFDTLVEAGYPPEMAYFECLHELKLIVDLVNQGGLSYMRRSISDTAEYGDYVAGPRVIDEHVRDNMRRVLQDVQSGSFARRWVDEFEGGASDFKRMRVEEQTQNIEVVGRELRSMMPWLEPKTVEE